MTTFDFLLLVIVGLWIYSRSCLVECAQHYYENPEDFELIYSSKSEIIGGSAGAK